MNRRKMRWTAFLLSSLATMPAKQSFAERNPFQPLPVMKEEHTGDMPKRGMVCDGERRHYWTIAADGHWRQRDPPAKTIQTHPPSSFDKNDFRQDK